MSVIADRISLEKICECPPPSVSLVFTGIRRFIASLPFLGYSFADTSTVCLPTFICLSAISTFLNFP